MCKKSLLTPLYTIFLLILLAFPAQAEGARVVEFFTSQGCPACPGGDKIFGKLAESNDDVIALGCHVTYFNRRWEDTMSRIFCDARQGAYREAGVTSKVYTPQVVVNGLSEAIGNNEQAVYSAISRPNNIIPLKLSTGGGYIDITLPRLSLRQKADVWLFAFDDTQTVNIGAGSNAGKTISYAHPVTNLTKLLAWDGKPVSMSFPLTGFGGDNYAVIAQYQDYSGIVAAGQTR